jgi:hypothetical protein
MQIARMNETTANIAANPHRLNPNALAIRASDSPTPLNANQTPGLKTTYHRSLRSTPRLKKKAREKSHTQIAKEQAMLKQPIPFATVFWLMTGK